MKLRGVITQMDKDSKTAKLTLSDGSKLDGHRIKFHYSGSKEESPSSTLKIFEPILLGSMTENTIITVHIDEDWHAYLIEKLEIGKF